MSSLRIRRLGRSAVLWAAYVAAIAVCVPLLAWNGLTQQLNAALGDLILRLAAARQASPEQPLAILAVDDASLAAYGPLPLGRPVLAKALDLLAEARPRVLVVDILLAGERGAAEDALLAQALSRFPRRVLAGAIQQHLTAANAETQGDPWVLPLPLFQEGAVLGHAHAEPDSDGIVRSVLLRKRAGTRSQWALGLQAARLYLNAEAPLESGEALLLGAHRIPSTQAGNYQLFVNYIGPEKTIPHHSIQDLVEGRLDPRAFAGKIVIVGVTAQGGGDRLLTPFSLGTGMSGAEIHANLVRTILDDAYLRPPGMFLEFTGFLLVCGLPVWAARRLRGFRLALSLAALALGLPLATYWAFLQGVLLPLGSYSVLFVAASLFAVAGEYGVVATELLAARRRQREYASRVQAIAHEIKTPLTAIQGSSEIIFQSNLSEEKRARLAGLIHKESKRLTELVHTFLDVERLASGAMQLQLSPVPLAAVCEEAAERARLLAERKHIQIECSACVATAYADRELLGFAIYNLLTNAVKYSPPETTVRLTAAKTGNSVRIAVSDEGCGIAEPDQQRIFERFYRVSQGTESAVEGSGVGLALAKEILAQHGGEILVDSKPGQGSCFTLVLPLSPGEIPQVTESRSVS